MCGHAFAKGRSGGQRTTCRSWFLGSKDQTQVFGLVTGTFAYSDVTLAPFVIMVFEQGFFIFQASPASGQNTSLSLFTLEPLIPPALVCEYRKGKDQGIHLSSGKGSLSPYR